MHTYDIIIVGAGAAGLLLADALGRDPYFSTYSVLLLEKESKKANDRTWCFWEKGSGSFDTLLHASWKQLHFKGSSFSARFPISPYSYKMLRASDFYKAYHKRISGYANVTIQQGMATGFREEGGKAVIDTETGAYSCTYLFNSAFSWDELLTTANLPVLQQHFKGWFVRTQKPVFDLQVPTFMDFSIPQHGNTRFMYLLPFSETEALVEYTLFSKDLLENREYEAALNQYMKEDLKCSHFEILQQERGRIPMTCHDFGAKNTDHIVHIGAAGGWAKPSTGYTFMNTHRKTAALLTHLKSGKPLSQFSQRSRFWWYDLLLLDILDKDNIRGGEIFEALFSRRKVQLILKFLDEQTSFSEDIRVIWACPKWDFLQALRRRLFKGFR